MSDNIDRLSDIVTQAGKTKRVRISNVIIIIEIQSYKNCTYIHDPYYEELEKSRCRCILY